MARHHGLWLPAAMGVKLHYPDAEVVCVTGEGSFQMNLQEFSTCSQYDIPVKIVCLNNQSLGMVRQWQDMNYDSRHSQSYVKSLPDFHKLTDAYGHKAITVKTEAELIPALEEAFALKMNLCSSTSTLIQQNMCIPCWCLRHLCVTCG